MELPARRTSCCKSLAPDVAVQTAGGTSAITPVDEYTYTFSNAGYAIGITASTPSPGVNGAVTLVASANRDVGPTPYGLSIIDTTTGQEVAHVQSGSTISAAVTRPAATTHSFVAMVCNGGGANAQASSSVVAITWS